MKNKFLAFGMAAMAALVVFAACDNGDNPGPGTKIANLIGGKTTVGETSIRFSVNAETVGKSARAAVGNTFTPVSGKLEYGNMVIKIEGFYDPTSGNFSFSGAAGILAFEFFGQLENGQAAGKLKTMDGDDWTEQFVVFNMDHSFFVEGTAQDSAASLPQKWTGKWTCEDKDEDEFFRGNNQLREQWGTGGDMIITPHSFSFWFDVQERLDYIEGAIQDTIALGEIDDFGGEQNRRNQLMVEQIYNRQAAFSIYEITTNEDGSLDVLASNTTMRPDYDEMGKFIAEQKFVKLRFIEGTGEYGGELWIVMCTFIKDDPWGTSTDNIGEARAGTNFDYDRENWGLSDNFNLFVMKH